MNRQHPKSSAKNAKANKSNDDDDTPKNNDNPKKDDDEITEKPQKARKVAPKFSPESLNDPTIGLSALYKKVERLNSNTIRGDKESLSMLMRIYQQWIFQLFPADFGDMCNKLNSLPTVKRIVRNFIFDKKGFSIQANDRLLEDFLGEENEDEKNENEEQVPKPTAPQNFLDDDDIPDIDLNEIAEKKENEPMEILDLLSAENPDW